MTAVDESMMRRALRLAMRGRGAVEPNPMVGCVIARDDRVIGEGYHQLFGGPHAERQALATCEQDPRGASAYVTLEPCCHTQKKTAPCVPALIAAGLRRVIVGTLDPNPMVSGRGLAQLREAGIEVEEGVLGAEAKQLIAPFAARVVHLRPYVTLKWAQSADGKVAGAGGRRIWISNERSTRAVHELRARCDAILVGINTVLADDPLLLARGVERPRPLLRVVLDRELRMPTSSRLVQTARQSPVMVVTATGTPDGRRRELESAGARVEAIDVGNDGRLSLAQVLLRLPASTTHLLVEPGPTLAASFLREGLADRVWVIGSPKVIAEAGAPTAPALDQGRYPPAGSVDLDGDTLSEHLGRESPVFSCLAPSADFLALA
jgi:diaminohydroxyphosphoribosylaminopyrimidine deaminase / 5-amino-6-(5-phosphoribosylamino)uracil reductase